MAVETREEALGRVLARRARHRGRGLPLRVAVAVLAVVVLVASLPLVVVLPELGLPLLLWALSLLALEFDRAAQAYAGVTWRWRQFHAWFGRQNLAVKALVVLATLVVAIALLALLFVH